MILAGTWFPKVVNLAQSAVMQSVRNAVMQSEKIAAMRYS
jgi:hypothetical protein